MEFAGPVSLRRVPQHTKAVLGQESSSNANFEIKYERNS